MAEVPAGRQVEGRRRERAPSPRVEGERFAAEPDDRRVEETEQEKRGDQMKKDDHGVEHVHRKGQKGEEEEKETEREGAAFPERLAGDAAKDAEPGERDGQIESAKEHRDD